MRKFVDKGVGEFRDVSTGENKTDLIRDSELLKSVGKRPTFEEMAREVQFEDIHNMMYGFMSMLAHGNTFGVPLDADQIIEMTSSASASTVAAVSYVVRKWHLEHRPTRRDELLLLFHLGAGGPVGDNP
jgi:hypothetical protein